MILILEGIFIGINSKILSNLYQERAKQILKEDTILVKLVAEGNPRTKYQELFSNNLKKFPNITYPTLPFVTLGEQKMKRKSAASARRRSSSVAAAG